MDQLSGSIQSGRCGDEGEREVPSFKFQVVLEVLKAEGKGAEAKIARAYGVHPVTLAKWKRQFLERGPEIFGGKEEARKYKKRSANWSVHSQGSFPEPLSTLQQRGP